MLLRESALENCEYSYYMFSANTFHKIAFNMHLEPLTCDLAFLGENERLIQISLTAQNTPEVKAIAYIS
jgi:hypothetical protein